MKFFYCMIFGLLLVLSLGLIPKKSDAAPKYGYTTLTSKAKKSTVKAPLKKKITKIPFEDETEESGLKVLVIKQTEIKSLVDSIEKNYRAYTDINRYERIDKVSSDNQDRLKIKLTRGNEATISPADKPLILVGKGFASGFEPINNSLNFSFNSHLRELSVYETEKENDSSYSYPNLEEAQSDEKFLIFHNSSSIFGREPDILVDPKPKQFTKEEEVFEIIKPISETGVYFDQSKKVIVHLNSAEKPLDLIRDNSALLRHSYQALISHDP